MIFLLCQTINETFFFKTDSYVVLLIDKKKINLDL